jgi:AraC-like DNA-binding protein
MEAPASPVWITALNFVGAVNALLIAITMLALPATRRSVAARHLIGLLAIVGGISLMITLQHAWLLAWTPWREILEQGLTVLAGPLFLGYVIRALTGRSAPAWIYLPVAAFVLAAGLWRESLILHLQIRDLIWLQMSYSAAAAALILRARVREPERWQGRRHLLFFLGAVVLVHGGQLLRALRPDDPLFLDIVPLTLTIGLAAFLVYAIARSSVLVRLAREPAGGMLQPEDEQLAGRIRDIVQGERLYTDPQLGVDDLAGRLGVAPARVSRAVNRGLGMSFPQYLTHCRLMEAERLLTDPAERRYTVEGLGRQAGFGSRSAFYRAFRDKHGQSPASSRKREFSS